MTALDPDTPRGGEEIERSPRAEQLGRLLAREVLRQLEQVGQLDHVSTRSEMCRALLSGETRDRSLVGSNDLQRWLQAENATMRHDLHHEPQRGAANAARYLLLAALRNLDHDDDLTRMRSRFEEYHSPDEAARMGFLQGLSDAVSLDIFAADELIETRNLFAHRADALQRDWDRSAADFRNALSRLYDQVRRQLKDLSDRQGTLFNPDESEARLEQS